MSSASYLFVSGRSSAGSASSCWRETRLMQYTVSGRRDRISGPTFSLRTLSGKEGATTRTGRSWNPKSGGKKKINNDNVEDDPKRVDAGCFFLISKLGNGDESCGQSRRNKWSINLLFKCHWVQIRAFERAPRDFTPLAFINTLQWMSHFLLYRLN